MEEEKKNPMDLNGDGKVTLGEKVQYYAGKAGEKVEESVKKVYDGVKEDAKDALADAKVLAGSQGRSGRSRLQGQGQDQRAQGEESITSSGHIRITPARFASGFFVVLIFFNYLSVTITN